MWGLCETLDSMFSYQIWDIFIKLVASIGTLGAAIAAYRKYSYEKNRQVYERGLTKYTRPCIV